MDDETPKNPKTPRWSQRQSLVHTLLGTGFLVLAPIAGDFIIGRPFSAGSVFAVILAPVIYFVSRMFANLEITD